MLKNYCFSYQFSVRNKLRTHDTKKENCRKLFHRSNQDAVLISNDFNCCSSFKIRNIRNRSP